MRITRETDYAVRCVLYLSERPGEKIAISDIAKAMEIPPTFLPKIVQKLVPRGILESTKGVGGGVRLLRSPKEISLFDIVEAIEGTLGINVCVVENSECGRSPRCSVHPVWVDLQQVIENKLRSCTFQHLLSLD
jgi:Rrf2 family protein